MLEGLHVELQFSCGSPQHHCALLLNSSSFLGLLRWSKLGVFLRSFSAKLWRHARAPCQELKADGLRMPRPGFFWEVLCEYVRRVIQAQHFEILDLLSVGGLLYPQWIGVYASDFAQAFAVDHT